MPGFRGFKLMDINVATALFQVWEFVSESVCLNDVTSDGLENPKR